MTTMRAVDQAFANGAIVAALHPMRETSAIAVIRDERLEDIVARECLLDRAFGRDRFAKTSEILRAGRVPAAGFALTAIVDGEIAGTVRLWHVRAGRRDALLLGPLAVDGCFRSHGLGGALMCEAISRARSGGHAAILLVGDAPYYARFGFSAACTAGLELPGPVDRARFLGLELEAGALAMQRGPVVATGAFSAAPEAFHLAA